MLRPANGEEEWLLGPGDECYCPGAEGPDELCVHTLLAYGVRRAVVAASGSTTLSRDGRRHVPAYAGGWDPALLAQLRDVCLEAAMFTRLLGRGGRLDQGPLPAALGAWAGVTPERLDVGDAAGLSTSELQVVLVAPWDAPAAVQRAHLARLARAVRDPSSLQMLLRHPAGAARDWATGHTGSRVGFPPGVSAAVPSAAVSDAAPDVCRVLWDRLAQDVAARPPVEWRPYVMSRWARLLRILTARSDPRVAGAALTPLVAHLPGVVLEGLLGAPGRAPTPTGRAMVQALAAPQRALWLAHPERAVRLAVLAHLAPPPGAPPPGAPPPVARPGRRP